MQQEIRVSFAYAKVYLATSIEQYLPFSAQMSTKIKISIIQKKVRALFNNSKSYLAT